MDKCQFCGSTAFTEGYGLAAGPMGAYTYCDGCDRLIAFAPDYDGLSDTEAARVKAWADNIPKGPK